VDELLAARQKLIEDIRPTAAAIDALTTIIGDEFPGLMGATAASELISERDELLARVVELERRLEKNAADRDTIRRLLDECEDLRRSLQTARSSVTHYAGDARSALCRVAELEAALAVARKSRLESPAPARPVPNAGDGGRSGTPSGRRPGRPPLQSRTCPSCGVSGAAFRNGAAFGAHKRHCDGTPPADPQTAPETTPGLAATHANGPLVIDYSDTRCPNCNGPQLCRYNGDPWTCIGCGYEDEGLRLTPDGSREPGDAEIRALGLKGLVSDADR